MKLTQHKKVLSFMQGLSRMEPGPTIQKLKEIIHRRNTKFTSDNFDPANLIWQNLYNCIVSPQPDRATFLQILTQITPAQINLRGRLGLTLPHAAILFVQNSGIRNQILQALIANGAKPQRDAFNATPDHYAALLNINGVNYKSHDIRLEDANISVASRDGTKVTFCKTQAEFQKQIRINKYNRKAIFTNHSLATLDVVLTMHAYTKDSFTANDYNKKHILEELSPVGIKRVTYRNIKMAIGLQPRLGNQVGVYALEDIKKGTIFYRLAGNITQNFSEQLNNPFCFEVKSFGPLTTILNPRDMGNMARDFNDATTEIFLGKEVLPAKMIIEKPILENTIIMKSYNNALKFSYIHNGALTMAICAVNNISAGTEIMICYNLINIRPETKTATLEMGLSPELFAHTSEHGITPIKLFPPSKLKLFTPEPESLTGHKRPRPDDSQSDSQSTTSNKKDTQEHDRQKRKFK